MRRSKRKCGVVSSREAEYYDNNNLNLATNIDIENLRLIPPNGLKPAELLWCCFDQMVPYVMIWISFIVSILLHIGEFNYYFLIFISHRREGMFGDGIPIVSFEEKRNYHPVPGTNRSRNCAISHE